MDWIPIEDRLPVKPGEYLVTLESGSVKIGYYSPAPTHKNPWLTGAKTTIAWMPMPERYKED